MIYHSLNIIKKLKVSNNGPKWHVRSRVESIDSSSNGSIPHTRNAVEQRAALVVRDDPKVYKASSHWGAIQRRARLIEIPKVPKLWSQQWIQTAQVCYKNYLKKILN